MKNPFSSGTSANPRATAFSCTAAISTRSVIGRAAFCAVSQSTARAIEMVWAR